MTIPLMPARSPAQWRQARRLVEAYVASLDMDLAFQGIVHELDNLPAVYGAPKGAFLLAQDSRRFVGCAGLRPLAGDAGEIKRLYVSPAVRGRGLGRNLAEGIIAVARELGYARLLLDTLPSMARARSLYESLGFRAIAPYRHNPVLGTTFLELALQGRSR